MTYFILTRLLPTFVLTFFAFALIRTQIFGSLKKRASFTENCSFTFLLPMS
ncbi:conserved domain protein [Peptoniphilus sp. oral taxon 375 str. F0436]|nr:conserved domain protein [Peptoniphilus sp. oral taxon 375 str. F0436]